MLRKKKKKKKLLRSFPVLPGSFSVFVADRHELCAEKLLD